MNRPHILSTRVFAIVLSIFFASSTADAQSIEIEEVVWGFDGKAVPNEFNPLSVLVFNPSADNFDGTMQLVKYWTGDVKRKGAVLVEPVFLSPYARRWVQFYPFVQREQEEWHITWQPGIGRELQRRQPPRGEPAHVLLDAADTISRGGSLRAFNEELFPPFVSATAGLASVTLDHQPRLWKESRQQALIDWLHAGGELHILHEATGEFPKFTGGLAELNTPVDEFRVGAGTIYRHPRTRREVDRQFVDDVIIRLADRPQDDEPQEAQDDAAVDPAIAYGAQSTMMFSEIHQSFLKELKKMTRPDHNWLLIHAMSIVYIAVIFPGCWYIGRRWRDYRITLGVLLATVALFSLGFHQVGEDSYDSSATVNSVAIVRPLPDGNALVTSWSNIFGTSKRRPKVAIEEDGSKVYDVITHEGEGRLYSTGQENESVSGIIQNGIQGQCLFDIPPFSSRETVNRYKTQLKPIELNIDLWQGEIGRPRIELSIGDGFPAQTHEMYALVGSTVYRAYRNGERVRVGNPVGELTTFLQENNMGHMHQFGFWNRDDRPADEIFRTMFVPMIARQLGVNNQKDADHAQLSDGRLRLFIFADLPRELWMSNPAFQNQQGRVMYCIDLFNPNET